MVSSKRIKQKDPSTYADKIPGKKKKNERIGQSLVLKEIMAQKNFLELKTALGLKKYTKIQQEREK